MSASPPHPVQPGPPAEPGSGWDQTRMPFLLSLTGVTAVTVRGASVGLDRVISMFIPMMHLGSSQAWAPELSAQCPLQILK